MIFPKHIQIIACGCLAAMGLIGLAFSNSYSDTLKTPKLLIKEVQFDANIKQKQDYVEGRHLYRDYSYYGFPEQFVIKKSPDIVIHKKEIERIVIIKQPFSPPDISFFTVRFYFSDNMSKDLAKYSESKLNEFIALEVDGEILAVSKIINMVDKIINVTMAKKNIDSIKMSLEKLSAVEVLKKE